MLSHEESQTNTRIVSTNGTYHFAPTYLSKDKKIYFQNRFQRKVESPTILDFVRLLTKCKKNDINFGQKLDTQNKSQ